MGLSARDRTRYARHLLLPQLGEAGQLRLLETTLAPAHDADHGVLAVARGYLERAGVRISADRTADADADASSVPLTLPSRSELDRIAGRPELLEAARALAGALTAVSAIQRAARIEARPMTDIPVISSEEA